MSSHSDNDASRLQALLCDPHTVVICLDGSGTRTLGAPSGFELGSATLIRPDNVLEMLTADCFGRAVAAFLEGQEQGYGSAPVELADHAGSRRLEVFDERDQWGCLVVTLSPMERPDDASPEIRPPSAVRPRWIRNRLDLVGRHLHIDEAITPLLGWSVQEYASGSSIDRVHPDDRARSVASFAELLARPGGQTRIRQRILHRDGEWRWFEVTHTNLLHTDEPHVLSESLDVTDEMAVHATLQKREELLALLTDSLPVGVLHLNPDGTPDISNAAWRSITGLGHAAPLTDFLAILADPEPARDALVLAQNGIVPDDCAVTFLDPAGAVRHGTLAIRPLPGDDATRAVLLTLADMTESVSLQAELEGLVRNDHLTSVLNRFGVEELLDELLEQLDDGSPTLNLLYCDLNNFKAVNDTHGHNVGDATLVAVAEQIRLQLRPGDRVGRLGGDEFLVVLRDLSDAETATIVGRIQRSVAALSITFDSNVELSAAIGVSVATPGDDFDTVVSRADADMYRRKISARHAQDLSHKPN